MNSAEPCLASRPITTLDKPLEIKNAAIPAAVRPTTARFIPDGPGRTGPRNPAVPNSRKPLNDLRSSLSLFSESHLARREAVSESGSSAIQSKISSRNCSPITVVLTPSRAIHPFAQQLLARLP